MKLPFRRRGNRTRGQALVEFAIILPVLALLLVMAVDFGRVFFGWVALNNAARIGANEAALNPQAWVGTGDPTKQHDYRYQVIRDLNAIDCAPPSGGSSWQESDVPNPVFINEPSSQTSDPHELGDHVRVTLTCRFTVLTPLLGNLLGNPLTIKADAEFANRGGVVANVPVGQVPPPPANNCTLAVVPNLVGKTVADARGTWTLAGFTGNFSPQSGTWDSDLVTSQATSPTAAPGSCVDPSTSITVQHSPPVTCPAGQLLVPNLIGKTVASARTTWTGTGFTGSFLPSTGYDTDLVTSQSTSTGIPPGGCSVPSTLVTVGHQPPPAPICTAPDLSNDTVSVAQQGYVAAGFTGSFSSTGPSGGLVSGQSLVAGQPYVCTSDMKVTLKK